MKTRETKTRARHRITKKDGKLSDYSSLRTATGTVIPEVRKVLLDRVKRDNEITSHRSNIIYPSEMAKSDWCPKATYLRMTTGHAPSSHSSFTMENVFSEGNMIHNKWQGWLAQTGKMWGDWRCTRCSEYVKDSPRPDTVNFGPCVGLERVNFSLPMLIPAQFEHSWKYKEVTLRSTSLPVSGHADGALTGHNILIELKSLGIGSLRFEAPQLLKSHTHNVNGKNIIDVDGIWRDFHRPLTSHLKQGNIYLWMASELGLPFDRISIVYEFKANQQVKEFTVPYSPGIIAPLLDTASDIKRQIEVGFPPDCIKGEEGCSQCRPYIKIKEE